MDILVRKPIWICILAVVLAFTVVTSLPSPRSAHHYMYDIDIDFDNPSLGSHHREQRRTGRGESLDTWDCGNITQVPDDVRTDFPLDAFYQKYTHAYGIPIVSSNVSLDASLTRACYTVRFLLADRKDLRDAMYDQYGRVAVIALTERTTQIPEHSYLNSDVWDDRARGLGGTRQVPVTTDGEENILCRSWRQDRWYEEDILIHEFAHAIHLISLNRVDAAFDSALQTAYDMAVVDNLWPSTYAISRKIEYFAEGVQGFFNVQVCRSFVDAVHNHICTRDALKGYDRRLFDLITEVFPCMNTVVDRCNSNQDLAANQVLRMDCELPATTITTPLGTTTDAITTLTSTTEVPTTITTPLGTTTDAITTLTPTTEVTTTITTPLGTTTDAITTLTSTTEVTTTITTPLGTTTDVITTQGKFCVETTIVDAAVGSLTWPMTGAGLQSQSMEVCPLETQYAGLPRAVRNCSIVDGPHVYFEWEMEYEVRDCGSSRDRNDITIQDLAQVMVSVGNVVEVSQFLANLTAIDPKGLQDPNLTLGAVSKVLQNIVAAESGETEVADAVLQTVNNIIIGLSSGQVSGKADLISRSSIVKSFQAQVAQTLRREGSISLRQDSVQVEAVSVNRSEAVNGLGFASVQRSASGDTSVPREVSLNQTRIQVFVGHSEPSKVVASVRLPGSELDLADDGDNSTQPKLRASFIVYKDDTLFLSALKPGVSVGGVVVAVTLQDMVLRNLVNPVLIQYKTPAGLSKNTLQETKCVFWDFSLEQGVGAWSESGCVLAEVTNDVIACHCDHLTNFAVLVNIGTNARRDFQQALNAVSQIGCALCIILLSITLIASICVRPQDDNREDSYVDMSRPIHMQLCVSLLVLYVVFLAGVDGAKGSEAGCVFVAALLHYLTLVSVMLMTVDAWDLYSATVREGPVQDKRLHIVRDVVLAWGCPLIIMAITVSAALSYYRINEDDTNSVTTYCFLKPGIAMYLGLLLPIGLFLAHNITLCFLVARSLPEVWERFHSRQVSQRLQNVVGIAALTMLTWLFGILAITSGAMAYHIMVLLTATSQGVFIFIAFCIRRSEVREGVLARLGRLPLPGSSCLKHSNPKEKYEVQHKSAPPGTELNAFPSSAD
ncbi:adhesion G-protein coupled receptor G7-like isoform X2 [Patiria miniata]|uniref:Uncharacterized protein n=1 Tax=Patiria miniata TaxID=46514 RepID=A0A914AZI8_PATMI|nr:adhesion G-protein coupled receptor G7-like isoform X2 [Patiria miniata]